MAQNENRTEAYINTSPSSFDEGAITLANFHPHPKHEWEKMSPIQLEIGDKIQPTSLRYAWWSMGAAYHSYDRTPAFSSETECAGIVFTKYSKAGLKQIRGFGQKQNAEAMITYPSQYAQPMKAILPWHTLYSLGEAITQAKVNLLASCGEAAEWSWKVIEHEDEMFVEFTNKNKDTYEVFELSLGQMTVIQKLIHADTPLLNLVEAGEMMSADDAKGLSKSYVSQQISQGKLFAYLSKTGRVIGIPQTAVEDWVRRHKKQSSANISSNASKFVGRNKTIKTEILDILEKLTEGQVKRFMGMYSSDNLDAPLVDVLNAMSLDKLKHAKFQVENTLKANKKGRPEPKPEPPKPEPTFEEKLTVVALEAATASFYETRLASARDVLGAEEVVGFEYKKQNYTVKWTGFWEKGWWYDYVVSGNGVNITGTQYDLHD